MTKFDHITNKHVFNAAAFIDEKPLPKNFLWSQYWVVVKEKEYPFKYLMRMAHKFATDSEDWLDFQSNKSSRGYLGNKLGYTINYYKEGSIFFTIEEIKHFASWVDKEYISTDPVLQGQGERIAKGVLYKTDVWSKVVALELGWGRNFSTNWIERGWIKKNGKNERATIFKHYTWARVYKLNQCDRKIYFTIGVEGRRSTLVYKLDCQRQGSETLSREQIEKFDSMIAAKGVDWREVPISKLDHYGWRKLINETKRFIKKHEQLYDELVRYVWDGKVDISKLKNQLVIGNRPKGLKTAPERKHGFKGSDFDFRGVAKTLKAIGDIGEELVVKHEKNILSSQYAKFVKKVKVGKGYDVFSRFSDGSPKYIEVKSTTGNNATPFYLSENEIAFMRKNKNRYYIYRLYNLDKKNKTAEFFKIEPSVEERLITMPTEVRCFIKDIS